MKDKYTPPHPKTLEEIERDSIPSLVEVPREEGIDVVRQVLRDVTGWPRDYSPPACTYRATEEQKRTGWEWWLSVEKIVAAVLKRPTISILSLERRPILKAVL
jgi:hypothetical protein